MDVCVFVKEVEMEICFCAVCSLHNLTWQPWIQSHFLNVFVGQVVLAQVRCRVVSRMNA